MAVIKFHPDLKQQENQAELAEQLERLLRFLREHDRPVRWPDQAEQRRAENDSRRDFTDGERLAKLFPQPSERPSGGDDHDPLDQNELEMAFDGDWIHKLTAGR